MSYSILLVDDNEVNLKLAQQILVASGYEVRTAVRGEQAIEMAGTRRPDLILLDIRLPDIDGLEVLRRLRTLPALKDVPIVAMTAQAWRRVVGVQLDGTFFCLQAAARSMVAQGAGGTIVNLSLIHI